MRISADTSGFDDLGRKLRQDAEKLVKGEIRRIQRAVRAVRCSEHGQQATAHSRRIRGAVQFTLGDCCCEDLRKRAQAELDRATKA